jgi:chromosome segregation ATPase
MGRQLVQLYPAIVGETFTWTPVGFNSSHVARWQWYFRSSQTKEADWSPIDNQGLSIVPDENQQGGNFKLIITFETRFEISGTSWPILGREQASELLKDASVSRALQAMGEETRQLQAVLKQIRKANDTDKKLTEIKELKRQISDEKREIKELKRQISDEKREIFESQNMASREHNLQEKNTELEIRYNRLRQERDDFQKRISAEVRMLEERKKNLSSFETAQNAQLELEKLKLRREVEKFLEDKDLQSKLNGVRALREQLEFELKQVEGLPATWGRMSPANRRKISKVVAEERETQRRDVDKKSRERAKKYYGADDRWT